MNKTSGAVIRAVVFQEDKFWLAQCLEYDICVQADDPDTVVSRLGHALQAEQQLSKELHGSAFAGIEQAPQKYFEMWEGLQSRLQPVETSSGVPVELKLCA